MDVDQVSSNTESVDNCYEEWVAFNRSSGMRSSAYEHLIPERLFSTEENPAEGVSTAKALALAMAQGQRVYTLTQDNSHNLSQITIDSEARTEIQNAIQRGYEVTVHETPLNVNGWQGSGYAIIDPENGIGAYKISGGSSGGLVDGLSTLVSTLLGAISGALERFKVSNLGKVIFSDTLKKLQKLAGNATKVGYLALAAELLRVSQGGFDASDSLGRVSVALFAFAVTSFLVTSLLATAVPIIGFIGGALIAYAIAAITSAFNNRYFNN